MSNVQCLDNRIENRALIHRYRYETQIRMNIDSQDISSVRFSNSSPYPFSNTSLHVDDPDSAPDVSRDLLYDKHHNLG